MGYCVQCNKSALYECKPCRALLCKEHKKEHEKLKRIECFYERVEIQLTAEQIVKIVENLSVKLSKLNECDGIIIQETNLLIRKIGGMSLLALKKNKDKKHYYTSLLEMSKRQ